MEIPVPDINECARLMEQYTMLPNIRHHSLVVATIADLLVTKLQGRVKYPLPSRNLCVAGALLHDIAKTQCLDGSCDHAREGAAICTAHGYPEVAEIVGEHVQIRDQNPSLYEAGCFSAKDIVYYADKRVRHNEIVRLEERLAYILEHYGRNDKYLHGLIKKNFTMCQHLETHLFSFLDFTPNQLAEEVNRQEDTLPAL